MLSFPVTKALLSRVGKEERGGGRRACFLLIPVINKEAETPSSLNQTRRTFEASPHEEQREAVKLDLLSLRGYPVAMI